MIWFLHIKIYLVKSFQFTIHLWITHADQNMFYVQFTNFSNLEMSVLSILKEYT